MSRHLSRRGQNHWKYGYVRFPSTPRLLKPEFEKAVNESCKG